VQSAYCSKLVGIAGIITAVEMLCARYSIKEGAIEIGLDGSEALNQSCGTWPLAPKQADYDMLCDICRRLAQSNITWHWHWIRGHQDKHTPLRLLDFWAQNNVYMDKLAKSFMAQAIAQDMDVGNDRFVEEGCSVSYRKEKLSRLITDDLYQDLLAKNWLRTGFGKAKLSGNIIANRLATH
jgi:hypothetical protein